MTKVEVFAEPVAQRLRNHRRANRSGSCHRIKQFAVPRLTPGRGLIDLDGGPLEDVLDAGVKGMQQRGQGGKLDPIGRKAVALGQQGAVYFNQLLQLRPFYLDLLAKPIPHVVIPLPL